jgi:hypothetical protein
MDRAPTLSTQSIRVMDGTRMRMRHASLQGSLLLYQPQPRINISTIGGIIRLGCGTRRRRRVTKRIQLCTVTPSLILTQTGLCGPTLISFTVFAIDSWLAYLLFQRPYHLTTAVSPWSTHERCRCICADCWSSSLGSFKPYELLIAPNCPSTGRILNPKSQCLSYLMNYTSTSVPISPFFPITLNHHQVTADAWATRIPQLIHLGNRYNKPVLERIWLALMVM